MEVSSDPKGHVGITKEWWGAGSYYGFYRAHSEKYAFVFHCWGFRVITPHKYIESHTIIRSPYTPYSIYLRGTIRIKPFAGFPGKLFSPFFVERWASQKQTSDTKT